MESFFIWENVAWARPIFAGMAKQFGFPKTERLKSRKQIDGLFDSGKAFSVFPIRTVYRFQPATDKPGLLAGVSVSKKHFKRAVDRNRVKRLLREAYRLQKAELAEQVKKAGLTGQLFFLYTDKTIADFETIKAAMDKCLQRLCKTIESEPTP